MKSQQLKRALLGALMAAGTMGFAAQAHALTLTPFATPDNSTTWASLDTNNLTQSALESLVGVTPGSLALVYKQNFGDVEEGNGLGYYTTSFGTDTANDPLDPSDASDATITWDTGLKISCGSCFLIVKDGNHSQTPPPYPQYIFDISGWNGTDPITLSGFWPGPGAISNVAIWNNYDGGSGGGSLVPEPETYAMLLAGLGLVGFAARRKLNKTA